MSIIIISCSLHPKSRSYVLAKQAQVELASLGVDTPLYDLRDFELPFCDGTDAYDAPDAVKMTNLIREATTILMAVPIYNYDVNAAAKNLLEIGLRAWNDKIVGFLCAAGGRSSWMSPMVIANSLMLDFRCLIIPRFVYATGSDFGDDREETMYISAENVQQRITQLAQETVRLTNALA